MNKKNILLIALLATFIILGGIWIYTYESRDNWSCVDGEWVKRGNPNYLMPSIGCEVEEVVVKNFIDCVNRGFVVMESYPRQCRDSAGNLFFEELVGDLDKSDLIIVTKPLVNENISSPLEIRGQARGYWFFEADFPVKLVNEQGEIIGTAVAMAQSDWMTEDFVPFQATLDFMDSESEKGKLILERNNPSGLPENSDELTIPVLFEKESMAIKVYFTTPDTGGEPGFDCGDVQPAERQVAKTVAVARAALTELLKGVTAQEATNGYTTSINSGVIIQSLIIENGIAKVDFNDRLEFQIGGSCMVVAIRAQIEKTLLQFPTIEAVEISIDGRTEDILQP